jgi:glycerol kinase
MQLQADLIGKPVEVSSEQEATALGAAALAGLGGGAWESATDVARLIRSGDTFEPRMDRSTAEAQREAWRRALERALI